MAILGSGFVTKFGLAQLTGTATPEATETAVPACIVRPAETEGPYFVDEMLNRSDIRIDPTDGSVKDGVPLRLKFRVSEIGTDTCTPLEGAQVDIWHCDALGVYSDVSDPGFNTKGQKWLRGYQVTDADGTAEFLTIYPGWYQGRTVHIHFKIRTDPASNSGYEFTSQLFFDDTLTDKIDTLEPYVTKGVRTIRNEGDGIYLNGGDQLILDLVEEDDGYSATFDIGLDLSQPATQAGFPGGGQPPSDGRPGNPPGAAPTRTATPTSG